MDQPEQHCLAQRPKTKKMRMSLLCLNCRSLYNSYSQKWTYSDQQKFVKCVKSSLLSLSFAWTSSFPYLPKIHPEKHASSNSVKSLEATALPSINNDEKKTSHDQIKACWRPQETETLRCLEPILLRTPLYVTLSSLRHGQSNCKIYTTFFLPCPSCAYWLSGLELESFTASITYSGMHWSWLSGPGRCKIVAFVCVGVLCERL